MSTVSITGVLNAPAGMSIGGEHLEWTITATDSNYTDLINQSVCVTYHPDFNNLENNEVTLKGDYMGIKGVTSKRYYINTKEVR